MFSTSHTAVAFGISGASCMAKFSFSLRPPIGSEARSSSGMTGNCVEYRRWPRTGQPTLPKTTVLSGQPVSARLPTLTAKGSSSPGKYSFGHEDGHPAPFSFAIHSAVNGLFASLLVEFREPVVLAEISSLRGIAVGRLCGRQRVMARQQAARPGGSRRLRLALRPCDGPRRPCRPDKPRRPAPGGGSGEPRYGWLAAGVSCT